MRFMCKIKILLTVILSSNVCHAQPIQKIINGIEVKKPLPYIARLYAGKRFNDQFFCGGSLIAPGWILTAGHCADFVTNETIVGVGGLKVHKPTKTSLVHSVYFDDWNDNTLQRDWALLKLKRKIKIKSYPKLARKNKTGLFKVFGWGTTDVFGMFRPQALQVIIIPIWSNQECIFSLGDAFDYGVMVCGGVLSSSDEDVDGKDTCYGDSGGPVTNLAGNIIYGLTSWGFECASSRTPGVYASIPVARDWILKTIKKFS